MWVLTERGRQTEREREEETRYYQGDYPRLPYTTRGHPRLPDLTRGDPRSPEISRATAKLLSLDRGRMGERRSFAARVARAGQESGTPPKHRGLAISESLFITVVTSVRPLVDTFAKVGRGRATSKDGIAGLCDSNCILTPYGKKRDPIRARPRPSPPFSQDV